MQGPPASHRVVFRGCSVPSLGIANPPMWLLWLLMLSAVKNHTEGGGTDTGRAWLGPCFF
jgi:hypothetical protein